MLLSGVSCSSTSGGSFRSVTTRSLAQGLRDELLTS